MVILLLRLAIFSVFFSCYYWFIFNLVAPLYSRVGEQLVWLLRMQWQRCSPELIIEAFEWRNFLRKMKWPASRMIPSSRGSKFELRVVCSRQKWRLRTRLARTRISGFQSDQEGLSRHLTCPDRNTLSPKVTNERPTRLLILATLFAGFNGAEVKLRWTWAMSTILK